MKKLALAVISLILVAYPSGAQQGFIWDVNYAVRDWSQNLSGGKQFPLDDYLQFAPALGYAIAIPFADGDYTWQERTCVLGTSFASMMAICYSFKFATQVERPNGRNKHSFPSAHTAMAFMGAELVRREYGPWWGLAAYSSAAVTGFLRIYNNWHWTGDVLVGAGVGVLSACIGYWLLPWEREVLKLDSKNTTVSAAPSYYAPLNAPLVSFTLAF
jgi:membrane-associated phospholipid phosphatase